MKPSTMDVVAACFLMLVCLWVGSEHGKSECQKQEIRK